MVLATSYAVDDEGQAASLRGHQQLLGLGRQVHGVRLRPRQDVNPARFVALPDADIAAVTHLEHDPERLSTCGCSIEAGSKFHVLADAFNTRRLTLAG